MCKGIHTVDARFPLGKIYVFIDQQSLNVFAPNWTCKTNFGSTVRKYAMGDILSIQE
jgi:hypothetical protein